MKTRNLFRIYFVVYSDIYLHGLVVCIDDTYKILWHFRLTDQLFPLNSKYLELLTTTILPVSTLWRVADNSNGRPGTQCQLWLYPIFNLSLVLKSFWIYLLFYFGQVGVCFTRPYFTDLVASHKTETLKSEIKITRHPLLRGCPDHSETDWGGGRVTKRTNFSFISILYFF